MTSAVVAVVGSSVRAGNQGGHSMTPKASDESAPPYALLARTTPRALAIPRGQPRTVETARDPATLVTLAAYEFGADPAWMLRVMACESGGNEEAAGADGEIGVMQFRARTFKANGAKLGYHLSDITSTEAQARVAALMFASGASGLWTCAR